MCLLQNFNTWLILKKVQGSIIFHEKMSIYFSKLCWKNTSAVGPNQVIIIRRRGNIIFI